MRNFYAHLVHLSILSNWFTAVGSNKMHPCHRVNKRKPIPRIKGLHGLIVFVLFFSLRVSLSVFLVGSFFSAPFIHHYNFVSQLCITLTQFVDLKPAFLLSQCDDSKKRGNQQRVIQVNETRSTKQEASQAKKRKKSNRFNHILIYSKHM